ASVVLSILPGRPNTRTSYARSSRSISKRLCGLTWKLTNISPCPPAENSRAWWWNCDMIDWIAKLLSHPELVRMGHGQRAEDNNLGLGWLYYALARALRPATVV